MDQLSELLSLSQTRRLYLALFPITVCFCFFPTSGSQAQIKSPGAHARYSAELEPHGLVQWDVDPGDEGLGLGLRASIPVIENGPVTTINNSFAVGFGVDWAWSGDDCSPYRDDDCDAHNITIPAVAQWNFYFTDVVSAFVELGLGIVFETWDYEGMREDDDDFDVEPDIYFLVGPRFTVGNAIAIPLRIGWPYFSVGVSFLL
ncbi:MAG: hypothetical protein JXA30_15770 [Deltaproteobacteria bacterium]|nr:hypothetical protein [Deltaproteobacteria bacterium]